jgi:hypothetical protein|tara:strand:- start:914 stop:1147 length:234 start_codon:yes stop_codon:yes gene_type:complete
MSVFQEIEIHTNELKLLINESKKNGKNVEKAEKIYSELVNMLEIWKNTHNISEFSNDDLIEIFNTANLIIERAKQVI